ncbi:glycosyltransferase [Methylotuvimicrobium sp. KM2]|uniref:glycosyltransferase family 2 protein n=1 Tax=Methylotuvimicrobium sp. KM2 TaxID=3133976 RepID=UPI003100BC80
MSASSNFPLISIVMPCFNAKRHLRQSIGSVLDQTYPHWELIVIDDGSTDDSLGLLHSLNDERITVIEQTNQGVCKTRNRGIKAAKGEWIAFLDADDTWHPDCLSLLYRALCDDPSASLAYCGWQNVGLPGGAGKPFVPPDYETADKLELVFTSCRWPIHACLTRKSAIIEAGLFDESLLTAEDFLLWLKIAYKNRLTRVPEVLALYHFHDGGQASSNKARAAINHWLAQERFLQQNSEVLSILGVEKVKSGMHGELLNRGFECYWQRDLVGARAIFRKVMLQRYGSLKDWVYMLPSLLPLFLHRSLISLFSR